MQLNNVILLLTLSSAYSTSVKYTIESFTTDNEPCMSDCVHGKCRVGSGYYLSPCRLGFNVGLQYFTALFMSTVPTCLSKCGRFGESYDWCYVSEDYTWDYCSSHPERKEIELEVTKDNGPCKKPCDKRGNEYFCATFFSSPAWDYCEEGRTEKFIQSYTRTGEKCVGACGKNGATYNRCKKPGGSSSNWEYCALPALSLYERSCKQCSSRSKRSDPIDNMNLGCPRGIVEEVASTMEARRDLLTRSVDEALNPVTSYTVLWRNQNEPCMPVVVRARIEPHHIPASGSRTSEAIPSNVRQNLELMGLNRGNAQNNNDQAGHLIAFMNGGPAAIYNFAPQTRRLNAGTNDRHGEGYSLWLSDEYNINTWVSLQGGSAEQTVLVLYSENWASNFRPIGFGTSISYYNPDGSLFHTCEDYFFSNDPNFMPVFHSN